MTSPFTDIDQISYSSHQFFEQESAGICFMSFDFSDIHPCQLDEESIFGTQNQIFDERLESANVTSSEQHSHSRPKQIQIQPTSASSGASDQNEESGSKPHLLNRRRKLNERKIIQKLIQYAKRFSQKGEKGTDNLGETTKNLLTFTIVHIFQFIQKEKGKQFFENHPQLKELRSNGDKKKRAVSLEDFDVLFKMPQLSRVLQKIFKSKYLYRQVMTSRVTLKFKMYHLYFLDIFERNFEKGCFKSVSETKVEIEEEKMKRRRRRY